MTYHIETWFERDRQNVRLIETAIDGAEKDILCFWDDEVTEIVNDGFLDPKDWHGSAIVYATYLGLIEKES